MSTSRLEGAEGVVLTRASSSFDLCCYLHTGVTCIYVLIYGKNHGSPSSNLCSSALLTPLSLLGAHIDVGSCNLSFRASAVSRVDVSWCSCHDHVHFVYSWKALYKYAVPLVATYDGALRVNDSSGPAARHQEPADRSSAICIIDRHT